MGKLDGKTVIVTGASRGIGAEIARVLAAEGGRVACAARTLSEGDHPLEGSLETTVAGIRADGHEATAVAVNISEPADCERPVEAARAAYGPIDVLVNNAALTYFVPIKDYAVNRWMRSWAASGGQQGSSLRGESMLTKGRTCALAGRRRADSGG